MEQDKIIIWRGTNMMVDVYVDERYDQFFATLMSKYGDTLLTVGYSSPNGAYIRGFNYMQIKKISDVINDWWIKQDFSSVSIDEMLPNLYKLCQIANNVYNKI